MRLISKVVDSKSTTNQNASSSYSVTKKSYSMSRSAANVPSSAPSTPSGQWTSKPFGQLQKSQSITEVIESNRGFKPSDTSDPGKRDFLTSLTKRVFKVGLVSCWVILNWNVITRSTNGCNVRKMTQYLISRRSVFIASTMIGVHLCVLDTLPLERDISECLFKICFDLVSNENKKETVGMKFCTPCKIRTNQTRLGNVIFRPDLINTSYNFF